MTPQDNFFDLMANPPETSGTGANAPAEFSVSEISQKLKQVVEGTFSYVRIRGELSRVTIAKSGHIYTALKDENACLDAICWRGTAASLAIRPEEGLDVVVTGRLTTYPGRSNYQIIIETMELAGEGALLKMLEDRRKKLSGEGLFDPARKKALPYLPEKIGVITSPTGAVIRDIMHRLNDRFPRHVLLWPAIVQGEQAAAQVISGIKGFNSLPDGSPYKPDVLIVARGGGSLEDLMPFNDETLVRAVAASRIPIISAVGHETDTTLIDYAADLRAPTPTGAAEKAVPVRAELIARIKQADARLISALQRYFREKAAGLTGLARALQHPKNRLENISQKLDGLSNRLDHALARYTARKRQLFSHLAGRLNISSSRQKILHYRAHLRMVDQRLNHLAQRTVQERAQKLNHASGLLESLSFQRTLDRGYAIIKDAGGKLVTSGGALKSGDNVTIILKDGGTGAKIQ